MAAFPLIPTPARRGRAVSSSLLLGGIAAAALLACAMSPGERGFGEERAPTEPSLDAATEPDAPGWLGADADLGLDWPAEVIDPLVPTAVVSAFNGPVTDPTDPPQVYEPREEAGVPRDWHALEVLARAPNAGWIEMRLEVGAHRTRVIRALASVNATASPSWRQSRVPAAVWKLVADTAAKEGTPVEWTVRTLAADATGAPKGTARGRVHVLPLAVGVDVTAWQIDGSKFSIQRLNAAASSKQLLIDPAISSTPDCIGCHTTSPDGADVLYQQRDYALGGWAVRVAHPTGGGAFTTPSYLTPAAQAALGQCLTVPTTSPETWDKPAGSGRFMAVSRCNTATDRPSELDVIQLDGASDVVHPIARTGDAKKVATPSWSPTGTFIAYTSCNMLDGRVYRDADPNIAIVPVDVKNGTWGGAVTLVPGASLPTFAEFYPSVSPDGELVAFTRAAPTTGEVYDLPGGEIWVAPVAGGDATKLVGHDEPAITDLYKGPLTNSWPRVTPASARVGSDTWYGVAFSSRRGPGVLQGTRPYARMYVLLFKRDAAGVITPYAPVLIPGQTFEVGNHTPDSQGITAIAPPPPVK